MKTIALLLLVGGSAFAQCPWSDFSAATASTNLSGAMNNRATYCPVSSLPLSCTQGHEKVLLTTDSPPREYYCSATNTWTVIPLQATGTAGGDLSGTYPNPTVASIGGHALSLAAGLTFTGAFNAAFTVPSASTWALPSGGGSLALLNSTMTGTWNGGLISPTFGGTGANNSPGAAGHVLRSNGATYVDSAIQAGDVPTLNQSTTGNALTATTATNVAGGAVGSVPYQSAAGATAMLAGNTAATDQVVVSRGSGAAAQAPTLSNNPALSATNMTSFPGTVVQTNQSNTFTTGTQDASGATHTLPAAKGLAASKPATCTIGEEYFATDATAGQNKYYCAATNTWTQAKLTLTTTGSSGAATLVGNTINVPIYSGGGGGGNVYGCALSAVPVVSGNNTITHSLGVASGYIPTWKCTNGSGEVFPGFVSSVSNSIVLSAAGTDTWKCTFTGVGTGPGGTGTSGCNASSTGMTWNSVAMTWNGVNMTWN